MATTEAIGLYALSYYLQRIRSFLESEKKTLSFPHIAPELQNVLEKIVTENTEFIHDNPQFDNKAKLEAAKVTAAMETLENIKLIHEFQYGNHGQKILVYKKIQINSPKPIEPTTKSSKPVIVGSTDSTRDSLVTTSFKLRCLNASVKFVKDDSELMMKYPQMESCQAEFVLNMLLQGKEGRLEQSDVGFGYRSMYAPLWESMKLFSLKYDYKIEYAPGINHTMKRVIFEKIPKYKEPLNMVNNECNKLNTSISSHSSSATSTTSSKSKTTKIGKKPQTMKKSLKLIRKMEGFIRGGYINMEFMSHALQRINEFMFDKQQASIIFQQVDHNHQYFLEHVEVLAKSEMSYMLFDSECQRYLSSIQNGFSKNIFYETRLGKKINSKKNPMKDIIFEKVVRFPTKENHGNEENISNNILDSPVQTNSDKLSENDQKRLLRLKSIKDEISQSSGENYIQKKLTEISKFLSADTTEGCLVFKKTNQKQAVFLKYVHIFSKFDESYAMFSQECQDLLCSIKMNAKRYEMQFHWEIDATENDKLMNVTIKKKLKNAKTNEAKVSNVASHTHVSLRDLYLKCRQKLDERDFYTEIKQNGPEMKRSSSLNSVQSSLRLAEKSAITLERRGSSGQRPLSCKEKLREGLSQPVKSEKAVKIMQSMGWTGGALGLRGDGITEPIMPSIDLAKRAGLGHVPAPKKAVPKKTKTKAKQQEPSNNSTAPYDVVPEAIASIQLPPGILPTGLERDSSSKIIYLTSNFHVLVLRGTLELVANKLEKIYFIFSVQKRAQKANNFILQVVQTLNARSRMSLSDKLQIELLEETMEYFVCNKGLKLFAYPKQGTVILRKKGHKPFLKIPETKTTQSRDWYPKTFQICENIEATDLKHQKLLAAILKPIQQKTIDEQKPVAETTNLTKPIEVATAHSEPFEMETAIKTKPIKEDTAIQLKAIGSQTIQSEPIEVETTIQPKPIEVETTIQQKTTDYRMQSKTLSPSCSSSLKSDYQISKETTATSNLTTPVKKILETPRWVDIMNAENLEESDGSDVDIGSPPKLKDLIQKYLRRVPSPTEIQAQKKKATESNEVTTNMQNLKAKRKKIEDLENMWKMYLSSDPEKISPKTLKKQKRKIKRQMKKMRKAEKKQMEKEKTQMITYRHIPYNMQESSVIPRNQIETTIAGEIEISTNISKQQELTTQIHNSQLIDGYLILEKHPTNNNYSTGNKNLTHTTTTSNKEKIIANDPAIPQNNTTTDQKESLNVDSKNFKNDITINVNNNHESENENKKKELQDNELQENDDINKINNRLLTIDLGCDGNTENMTNDDTKVEIDNNTHKTVIKTDQSKNDVRTDTFNAEKTEITVESKNIVTDTTSNINGSEINIDCNHTEKSAIELNTKIKTDKDSLLDYESSDDCQVIIHDDSVDTIELNNDEEKLSLCDNEMESSVTARKVFDRMTCDLKDAISETENAKDAIKNDIDASKMIVTFEKDEFDTTQHRKRASLDSPNVNKKRHKSITDFKKLCILSLNYPQTKISNEKAGEIQTSILNAIDNTDQLPLLICQGIQNGGLVYNCQDEKSLSFMENLIKTMEDLTIVYEFDVKDKLCHKMAFRINSFVEEPVNKILNRLQLYNFGLNCTNWRFIKKEQYGDFAVIYVEIDDSSFDYVRKADFVLYAGNDCARFTIIWD